MLGVHAIPDVFPTPRPHLVSTIARLTHPTCTASVDALLILEGMATSIGGWVLIGAIHSVHPNTGLRMQDSTARPVMLGARLVPECSILNAYHAQVHHTN